MSADIQISELCANLSTMPSDMRLFSLSLRSLYTDRAVSGELKESKELNKLRDDTRRDAKTYVSGILPICTNAVRGIRDYFENYQVLTIEEWRENLPDLIKDVDGYIQVCQVVTRLHKDVLAPLMKRRDAAQKLLGDIENLNVEYETQVAALRAEADESRWWALSLCTIPMVQPVATSLLLADADSKIANAVALTTKAKINDAACVVIRDALIPALANFINGLDAICKFMNAARHDLGSFENRAAIDEEITKYYQLMKNRAPDVMGNCRLFFAVIPGMETDLDAIPTSSTDPEYVDEWLKAKEVAIRDEYGLDEISSSLEKMLKLFVRRAGKIAMASLQHGFGSSQ